MRHTETSLRQYYAARSREYERIYSKPERQADLARLKELLPPMFADRHVLEVACGTAYWTRFLAREAKSVVAVDANAETLEVANEKAWSSERASFRVADAYLLPDDLGMFDGAFAGFWWSHVPIRDRPRFLNSLDRRLAPGARIVLLDNRFVEGSSTPIAHRDDEGNTYQSRRLENGSEHVVLKNFPSDRELRADVSAFACNTQFVSLEYYWLFTCEKATAA